MEETPRNRMPSRLEHRSENGEAEVHLQSVTCPECRKEMVFVDFDELPFFPFCSNRCKLLDLGRWFRGEYSIDRPIDPFEDAADPDLRSPDSSPPA